MTLTSDGPGADASGFVRRPLRELVRGHELQAYVYAVCAAGALLCAVMILRLDGRLAEIERSITEEKVFEWLTSRNSVTNGTDK